ncbi:M20 family peptidase [Kribbella pittospori]|uniref:M20 family peptidase n=1 Tax=Kribbella pittospori TaxID=722689 RepID=A0A4R0KUG6_9ACTN|nr:M20 family metallopeptidase [Kribbella pittospori]TCC63194.1 M20 family peptidase [Kribbella pittospori]
MHDLMLADLERLICCESPSSDLDALHRCADVLTGIGTTRLRQAPVRSEAGGRPVLRFGPADPAVLLLGHLDTVHPIGTLEQTPYRVIDGRVYGPGVFDMKLGLVQALHAMAACTSEDVGLLITADEELGSPASRTVIEAAAAESRAVLVLEASVDGKLKTARKGVSTYELQFTGRAAHAGLEPEKGANTSLALAQAILAVSDLADTSVGTTVTPTVARSGVTINTVPDNASLAIDVRAASKDEQERVDKAIRSLPSPVDGVSIEVLGGINRPPLEASLSADLFAVAQEVAGELGLPPLEGAHVGGGSDGNFTAGLGIPTLDGLGAVGHGAHTVHEWADVAAFGERTRLLTGLIDRIAAGARG